LSKAVVAGALGTAAGDGVEIVSGRIIEVAVGGVVGTASPGAFRNGHIRLGRAGAVSPGLEGTATMNDGTGAGTGDAADGAASSSAAVWAGAVVSGKAIKITSMARAKRVIRIASVQY